VAVYQVNEIYNTVQGEGVHVGKPATFIRLQGCQVGCSWCDTKYTWLKGGTRMRSEDIVQQLGHELMPLVVITGGEPTLYNLDDLILSLQTALSKRYQKSMIQLETSGQNNLKGELVPDWVTWSPKANLGCTCKSKLIHQVNEIKFVVDNELTLGKVQSVMRTFADVTGKAVPVVLMPEGTPPKPDNVVKALQWVKQERDMRLGDRLQWRLGIR